LFIAKIHSLSAVKELLMRSIVHGDNLIQLSRLVAFNCYLVREADGFTLVDTNLPGSAHDILDMAGRCGLPIVRIALTHAHGDHVGSLDLLREAMPNVEVAISARDARLLSGDRSLEPDEPQARLRGSYPTCSTRPTRLLAPGDRVGSLEVIAASGHTPGHVAFFDIRDQTLIAGDAFQTQGGLAVAGTVRLLFPFPALATWHKPTAIQSARALQVLNPTRLAVGHGPVLVDPVTAMDRAIRAAER
jgi:glyoxylase-like metal-dependent hydrolase (beta-lactamase superfamily II)